MFKEKEVLVQSVNRFMTVEYQVVEGISKKTNQPYIYIAFVIDGYKLPAIFLDHKDKYILKD